MSATESTPKPRLSPSQRKANLEAKRRAFLARMAEQGNRAAFRTAKLEGAKVALSVFRGDSRANLESAQAVKLSEALPMAERHAMKAEQTYSNAVEHLESYEAKLNKLDSAIQREAWKNLSKEDKAKARKEAREAAKAEAAKAKATLQAFAGLSAEDVEAFKAWKLSQASA